MQQFPTSGTCSWFNNCVFFFWSGILPTKQFLRGLGKYFMKCFHVFHSDFTFISYADIRHSNEWYHMLLFCCRFFWIQWACFVSWVIGTLSTRPTLHWGESCPIHDIAQNMLLAMLASRMTMSRLSLSLCLFVSLLHPWWCQEVARQGSDVSDAADATPPQSRVSSRCKWEPTGFQYDRNR